MLSEAVNTVIFIVIANLFSLLLRFCQNTRFNMPISTELNAVQSQQLSIGAATY